MLIKKTILPKIKRAQVSSYKARRLRKSLEDLEKHSVDILLKTGKVTKINVSNQDSLYAYRVDTSTRIVFSVIDGEIFVQDVVNTNRILQKFSL